MAHGGSPPNNCITHTHKSWDRQNWRDTLYQTNVNILIQDCCMLGLEINIKYRQDCYLLNSILKYILILNMRTLKKPGNVMFIEHCITAKLTDSNPGDQIYVFRQQRHGNNRVQKERLWIPPPYCTSQGFLDWSYPRTEIKF